MSLPTSLERKQCGCIVSITWGTDGESLLHPCAAHRENLVGTVGMCSRGRPGLITGRKELPWGLSWIGIGLDDGTAWSSRQPKPLTQEFVAAYAEAKIAPPAAPTPPVASTGEVWDEDGA